jgi:hypothetical protein
MAHQPNRRTTVHQIDVKVAHLSAKIIRRITKCLIDRTAGSTKYTDRANGIHKGLEKIVGGVKGMVFFLIPPVGLIPRGLPRLLNENSSRIPRLLAAGSFILLHLE